MVAQEDSTVISLKLKLNSSKPILVLVNWIEIRNLLRELIA